MGLFFVGELFRWDSVNEGIFRLLNIRHKSYQKYCRFKNQIILCTINLIFFVKYIDVHQTFFLQIET